MFFTMSSSHFRAAWSSKDNHAFAKFDSVLGVIISLRHD